MLVTGERYATTTAWMGHAVGPRGTNETTRKKLLLHPAPNIRAPGGGKRSWDLSVTYNPLEVVLGHCRLVWHGWRGRRCGGGSPGGLAAIARAGLMPFLDFVRHEEDLCLPRRSQLGCLGSSAADICARYRLAALESDAVRLASKSCASASRGYAVERAQRAQLRRRNVRSKRGRQKTKRRYSVWASLKCLRRWAITLRTADIKSATGSWHRSLQSKKSRRKSPKKPKRPSAARKILVSQFSEVWRVCQSRHPG
jgi:hypothetical protein